MPRKKYPKPKTIDRGRVAITFHMARANFAPLVAAARETGLKLDQFCAEALAQWLEQYDAWKAEQGAQVDEPPAPSAAPVRDWLSFSEVDARQDAQESQPAPVPMVESVPQDDEAPVVDSRANDPDDEDRWRDPDDGREHERGEYMPRMRPPGPGPVRVRGTSPDPDDLDEDEPPPTVKPVAASPFRTPNPAGIKWKQGKDYGGRSPGHTWAAVRKP